MDEIDVKRLAADVRSGDRRALSRALTLTESLRPDDAAATSMLFAMLPTPPEATRRLGVTGAPGAGKSTLIEALGEQAISDKDRLAVLTVDPSSDISGGSILGDKVRMNRLSQRPDVFIRSTPAGGHLGGVARFTRNAISLCEAAGYSVVIVETVGVGQSEQAIAGITDLVLLVLSPGSGDEMQGIKRGLLETVDVLFVNKADGDLKLKAEATAADYSNALRIVDIGGHRDVFSGSAIEGNGVAELWAALGRRFDEWSENGKLLDRRRKQASKWVADSIQQSVVDAVLRQPNVLTQVESLNQRVLAGEVSVKEAAELLLDAYLNQNRVQGGE